MESAHPLGRLMAERKVRLAVLAVAADVHPDTVDRWRKGRNVIPSDKLRPLADALGVDVTELLPPIPEEKVA